LVEVYEGFGYWEVEGGLVSRGGLCFYRGGMGIRNPIWGISARRALWSLYYVRNLEVVVSVWRASLGMINNLWSYGELVRVQVGVSGSPKCV